MDACHGGDEAGEAEGAGKGVEAGVDLGGLNGDDAVDKPEGAAQFFGIFAVEGFCEGGLGTAEVLHPRQFGGGKAGTGG